MRYDQYGQPMQLVGYDEYGQPVYQQVPQQPEPQYDSYGRPQQGYGYAPYTLPTSQQQSPPPPPPEQGYDYGIGQQPAVDTTQQWIPQQSPPREQPQGQGPGQSQGRPQASVPGSQLPAPGEADYRTEQFSFIEEPDEDSEDVIDWLKFTESRTERREEARRRGHTRIVSLVVVLALVLAVGVGCLWYAGKLPGVSGPDSGNSAATGAQQRNVILVHLHNTGGSGTSTAVLVDNVSTGRGTTLLLPNSLAMSDDDGTVTTLGKSVDDDGSDGTRKDLGMLLGAKISGTWRLDTPYLENLVDLVGNIEVDTDIAVPDTKKSTAPLVSKGRDRTLSGQMAVAYATYRAPGEAETKQLKRFGQVMQGILQKISDVPQAATTTVQNLAQVMDPSLTDKDLGASLAELAAHARKGDYRTTVLPVQSNGTLSVGTAAGMVKDILGGSVRPPERGDAVRVGISDGSGKKGVTEAARISLVNGGYSVVTGGSTAGTVSSQVTYGDATQRVHAEEVAKTLGLPTASVRKGKVAENTEVSVLLGQDYRVS